ncbi:30S ribosomal protein S4 [Candidatus Geothermarchaeota archaeon]|nr:MAG: 30S ribosomal protein S4 [Candidatus Geothermarchaeota archaeon]
MGDIKRARKKYKSPRRPWDPRLLEYELKLVGQYGLRNKRELRRTQEILRRIRSSARKLFVLPEEERVTKTRELVSRLARYGILDERASLDDILRLTVESLLERRLQTIVFKKGLAKTIYQARQLVTHGHIVIGDKVVKKPGKLLTPEEEEMVRINPRSPLAREDHPIWK